MESELIWKYLSLKASKGEQEKVQKWLADDPDGSHAELYFEIHKIYDGVTLFSEEPKQHKTSRSYFSFWRLAVAAAIAALLVVGSVEYSSYKIENRISARTETFSVPAGKTLQLMLEDGTELWLNSGTQIEKPVVFAKKNRIITLNNGEVLVDVAKDSRRPFVIKTPKADVRVLGTRFDVCLDNEEFQATLLRGSISILPNNGKEMLLKPYERATLGSDGILTMSRISSASAVESWTSGIIELVGVPFDELMRKFEKAFDISIVLKLKEMPRVNLSKGRVRVIDGVDHALKVLSMGADFQYDIDYSNNTITIY